MRYLLRIAFDGLSFLGTQKQAKGRTVQGELEKLLYKLYGVETHLECCSRLDRDVSASDFVCAFSPRDQRIAMSKIPSVLSGPFRGVLKVKSIEACPDSFSPRRDVLSKTYLYLLDLEGEPWLDTHFYHHPDPVDPRLFEEAMNLFVGEHDFSLFSSKEDRKKPDEDFKGRVDEVEVKRKGSLLFTFVKGPAFHRHQVRFMVGGALEVASNKRSLFELGERVEGRGDPSAPRYKAPGKGLILSRVDCDPKRGKP